MSFSDLRRFVHAATAASVLFCLSSCGGGGGGGSSGPVLSSTTFSTNENVALNGTLTATDPGGSAVTFAQGGSPKSGTVSGFTPAGQFVYTPNRNFTGSDSFSVTATDAGGHSTTGTISITVTVNQPPTTTDTVLRADPDSSGISIVNVLANATDPDKDKLTVTVTPNSTLVGTATVNSDGSVSIAGLGGFKGLTRFDYTVTDPSGATATGHAAVFVGEDPFRAAFVADAAGNGSYEVYMANFAGDPSAVTTATQGTLRLKGFAISDNGATIVYRTQDTTNAATTSLKFVQTAKPGTQVAIQLPNGAVPVTDASGKDQFIVSPDGNWIAVIAGQGSTELVVRSQRLAAHCRDSDCSDGSGVRNAAHFLCRFQEHLLPGYERRRWRQQIALLGGPEQSDRHRTRVRGEQSREERRHFRLLGRLRPVADRGAG